MRLRNNSSTLRKGVQNRAKAMRDDIEKMVGDDGDTITFEWKERVGAVWNPIYEVWEGGEITKKTMEVVGIGKVVDYAEDEMEYEWGRVSVGDCLIRFPYSFNIEQLNDKQELRFLYKGQKWKPDSALGIGDWLNNQIVSKILKGVKAID